jgi:uncharacterized protein YjbI with pentapeptide repeats
VLAGADCAGTNFKFADLRGADLTGANLEGARFEGSKVNGARVTEAKGVTDLLVDNSQYGDGSAMISVREWLANGAESET